MDSLNNMVLLPVVIQPKVKNKSYQNFFLISTNQINLTMCILFCISRTQASQIVNSKNTETALLTQCSQCLLDP